MTEFSQSQKQYMEVLFNKISATVKEDISEVSKELKTQINKIEQDIKGVASIYDDEISKLVKENRVLKQDINLLERKTRKNNIVIFGIESFKETLWNDVMHVFRDLLEIDIGRNDCSDIYKIGNEKNCPVKVEFLSYQTKSLVLNNAKKLKGKGIYINHDLCEEDRNNKKILIRHMKEAKIRGLQAYIKGSKLIIGKDTYTADQLESTATEVAEIVEKNQESSASAPSTPNPKKREKRLQKELGLEGEQEEIQEKDKIKANKVIKSDKTSSVKTRSNSVVSEKGK